MNAWGFYFLFFSSLLYFFILLFNSKTVKWYHIAHTIIACSPTSLLLWGAIDNWIMTEYHMDKMGFVLTIAMCVFFVIILTQQNRKSYSELLKKEIWGEWAKYQDK